MAVRDILLYPEQQAALRKKSDRVFEGFNAVVVHHEIDWEPGICQRVGTHPAYPDRRGDVPGLRLSDEVGGDT
jgi:hypothetical protein